MGPIEVRVNIGMEGSDIHYQDIYGIIVFIGVLRQ